VPIATYGFKLWYYSGAHRKGQVAKLAKMQHRVALWIPGAFSTSPVSGVGALAGLIPINLHLFFFFFFLTSKIYIPVLDCSPA
jgi:hypothetical protein